MACSLSSGTPTSKASTNLLAPIPLSQKLKRRSRVISKSQNKFLGEKTIWIREANWSGPISLSVLARPAQEIEVHFQQPDEAGCGNTDNGPLQTLPVAFGFWGGLCR